MPFSSAQLFNLSSTAQASYAHFDLFRFSPLNALTVPGDGDFALFEGRRFLGELADPLAMLSGYELLNHLPNDSTGFSASVFREKSTNKLVLAIRGTEQLSDLSEDVGRIGIQGFAGNQLVSLYRYYKSLTTAPGEAVRYSESEIAFLYSVRVGLPSLQLIRGSESFRAELRLDRGLQSLDASNTGSVVPFGGSLVATGHSLGGHLALLFGRVFPDVTASVITYNAPGISKVGRSICLLWEWGLTLPAR
jgi:hypothetical protein